VLEAPVLSSLAAIRGVTTQKPPVRLWEHSTANYQSLATRVMPGDDTEHNIILITSTSSGEGKSLTTFQLAGAIAAFGKTVLVVDADLRTPTLHKIAALSNREGVANIVINYAVAMEDAIDPLVEAYVKAIPTVHGVYALTSGPIPAQPADILGLAKLPLLLKALSRKFDVVLIDGPAALEGGDLLPLIRVVDGIVFIIDARRTRRRAAKQALRLIHQEQGQLLGIVLNRVNR
jgi:capsular exopolysaccharide synthesis family protein